MRSKGETDECLEEMVLEARQRSGFEGTMVVVADCDSVFRSKEVRARMRHYKVRVELRHAPQRSPRNNPFAEKHGGLVLAGAKALMMEAVFPPAFWGLMVLLACWLRRRIVRTGGSKIKGKTPLEVFEGKEPDFSKVFIPGSLAYWYVGPKERVDPKLGKHSGVGVYIMPGEIVGQQGHLVMVRDKFVAVPDIRVVEGTYPFKDAFEKIMLSRSMRGLPPPDVEGDEDSEREPTVLEAHSGQTEERTILEDGVIAGDYIGCPVMDEFKVQGRWKKFWGTVSDVSSDKADGSLLFGCLFDDGETVDYTYEDLKTILLDGAGDALSRETVAFSRDTALVVAKELLNEKFDIESDEDVVQRAVHALAATTTKQKKKKPKNKPPPQDALVRPDTYTWNWAMRHLSGPEKEMHVTCMLGEMQKLLDMGAIKWRRLPPGQRAIGSVGVFRWKTHDLHKQGGEKETAAKAPYDLASEQNTHDSVEIESTSPPGDHTSWFDATGAVLKARWCANGPEASAPSGGWEISAKVASVSHILLVLALAVGKGWRLKQMDVKSAFTQVPVDEGEPIFIRPLKGLENRWQG